MNRFPDGAHVWLRSRARRGYYVHADEDGSGVSLSTDRATLNAAWRVHRIVRQGVTYILLRCAAYGRYLALSASLARDGHRGREAAQSDFSEPQQLNVRWRVVFEPDGSGDVLLFCSLGVGEERYLRANGRYRRWNNGVTVDVLGSGSTMMHWTVVQIPLRPAPPALPKPSTDLGVPTGLLQRRTGPVMDRQRTIRYMRANDKDKLLGTETFSFLGRSVFNLTNEVAKKVGLDMSTITLCVHAGFHGRLTPLVVDLPRNEDPLDLVVLPNSSPAAMGLRHPNVDAPEPAPSI
ncbi:hypothetical protein BDA96_10G057800 [Sorghum bicolor]|uniref:DUF569 domain-containing protein n=1 Tax=Sorghum bicolor TaxID=4558 RepID=A0A921U027_SORBI|nr:hypothetical protein BDA96_10G057800 [Sorghum bicolor]